MKRDKLKGTSWKNQAGPRKSKSVVDKLYDLNHERYSMIERWEAGDHAVRVYSLGGIDPAPNQAAVREMNAIGTTFNWTITNENLTQMGAAIDEAMQRAVAARPIKDYTKKEEATNV